MTSKQSVGVIICGFGRAGQIHFRGILRNCRCILRYVVDEVDNDAIREKISGILDEYGVTGVQLTSPDRFDEVLKDPDVDAVLVTTPTDFHETYVRGALQAQKAVFCEKPVAAQRDRIQECYELAEQVKRPLLCAFNRRFDLSMSQLRDQVKKGEIGKVYQIKTTSRDFEFPSTAYLKNAPGFFHDSAVHDIDMVCWVLGERPTSVFAQGSAFNPEVKVNGDVDTIVIVLKFPSGVIASIDLSRHFQCGYDQRLEVLGSHGMLQVQNIPQDQVHSFTSGGATSARFLRSFPQRYKEAYEQELDHFVSVVLEPTTPLKITKDEVLLSSQVASACEKSLKEGKLVFI